MLGAVVVFGAQGATETPRVARAAMDEPAATAAAAAGDGAGAAVRVVAAGDIASSVRSAEQTAALVERLNPDHVLTLGDNAYDSGSRSEFATKYAPTWGRFLAKTRPSPGNHEYKTSGAAGYFEYFAEQTGRQPYYAWEAGSWRFYSLNSEIDMKAGSSQETWLRRDLAANAAGKKVLAYLHRPRFTCSSNHAPEAAVQPLWTALADAGADILLAGHNHAFERFEAKDASGAARPDGMRQFVVGTGGAGAYPLKSSCPGREAGRDDTLGVLQLALQPDGYDWQFVGTGGQVLDSGSDEAASTSPGQQPAPEPAEPEPAPSAPAPSAPSAPSAPAPARSAAAAAAAPTGPTRPAPPASSSETGASPASSVTLPRTGFEKRQGESWTSLAEEQAFLTALDAASDRVQLAEVGRSAQGRPLQLLTVAASPRSQPEVSSGTSILFSCSQHGDEPAGREACLQLARDFAATEDPAVLDLLQRSTILIVPNANPDGMAAGTRGNAAGVDLNRDHAQLTTPETRALAAVLQGWRADIVHDLHEYRYRGASKVLRQGADAAEGGSSLVQWSQALSDNYAAPAIRAAGLDTACTRRTTARAGCATSPRGTARCPRSWRPRALGH